MVVVSADEDGH